jgi:hypothetical protein
MGNFLRGVLCRGSHCRAKRSRERDSWGSDVATCYGSSLAPCEETKDYYSKDIIIQEELQPQSKENESLEIIESGRWKQIANMWWKSDVYAYIIISELHGLQTKNSNQQYSWRLHFHSEYAWRHTTWYLKHGKSTLLQPIHTIVSKLRNYLLSVKSLNSHGHRFIHDSNPAKSEVYFPWSMRK